MRVLTGQAEIKNLDRDDEKFRPVLESRPTDRASCTGRKEFPATERTQLPCTIAEVRSPAIHDPADHLVKRSLQIIQMAMRITIGIECRASEIVKITTRAGSIGWFRSMRCRSLSASASGDFYGFSGTESRTFLPVCSLQPVQDVPTERITARRVGCSKSSSPEALHGFVALFRLVITLPRQQHCEPS